jgi:hypothetical protein
MNKRRLQFCWHGVNRRLVLVGGVALTAEAQMAPRSTRAQAAERVRWNLAQRHCCAAIARPLLIE